jgi:hypothetical protein
MRLGKREELRQAVIESIHRMGGQDGFSGYVTTTLGRVRQDDIQHSSFIGDWLATATYDMTENAQFVTGGVFNSRGHLLHVQ